MQIRVLQAVLVSGWLALGGSMASATGFPLPEPGNDVIGEIGAITARHEDTLLDIGRRHGLGYEEILQANPGVDPWLPGAGTMVVLPKRFVLPPGPREGLVLNVPEMRLYYYPKPAKGQRAMVYTYPVSVGREEWVTPIGETKVVSKVANPSWTPPESIRREHAAKGDILPRVVPPGPNNPLGQYALRLGFDSYLIHGTNNPNGLGMRVTHGCMRLYPEDIEKLFHQVPVGTSVRIVNAPYKVGVQNGTLYLEAHPPLVEDKHIYDSTDTPLVRAVVAATQGQQLAVDWEMVRQITVQPLGLPLPISAGGTGMPVQANNGPTDRTTGLPARDLLY